MTSQPKRAWPSSRSGQHMLRRILAVAAVLAWTHAARAEPSPQIFEKMFVEFGVERAAFRKVGVEELRLSGRFSEEDLARIKRSGQTGDSDVDARAYDQLRPAVARSAFGVKLGLDTKIAQRAAREFEQFANTKAAESAELRVRFELGWDQATKRVHWKAEAETLGGTLRRMDRLWQVVLEDGRENPIGLFAHDERIFVRVQRDGFSLNSELKLDDPAHARTFLRGLMDVRAGGTTFVFADRGAADVLRRIGVDTEGWRVWFGIHDVVPTRVPHVYGATNADATIVAELASTSLPQRRAIVVLDEELSPALRSELQSLCPGCDLIESPRTTRASLQRLLRDRAGSMVTVVGHTHADSIGNGNIPVSWLRAQAGLHNTHVFVLGCNSARFGTGLAGQVQLNPILRRAAQGLAEADLEGFLRAVATPSNPLVVDDSTLGPLKQSMKARAATVRNVGGDEHTLEVVAGKGWRDDMNLVLALARSPRRNGLPAVFAFVQMPIVQSPATPPPASEGPPPAVNTPQVSDSEQSAPLPPDGTASGKGSYVGSILGIAGFIGLAGMITWLARRRRH